jgi:hypothetical protein
MWLKHLWNRFLGQPATRRGTRSGAKRPCRRLFLEQLETREVPASVTAASVTDLIADINAANLAGGSNTITLAAGATFTLSAAYSYGNGLPAIAANDNLTIIGNNDIIQRKAKDTTAYRLFDVSAGASLTLANLTLQGGLARGSDGGNFGAPGGPGLGGGIYVEGSTTDPSGVSVPGGTANLTNVTLTGNTAEGGNGSNNQVLIRGVLRGPGAGGDGVGGGIYVGGGGSLTMHLCSVSGNSATGGSGGTYKKTHASDGVGEGGGLYLAAGAVVGIDAVTLAQISKNHASTSNPDIFGDYTIIT